MNKPPSFRRTLAGLRWVWVLAAAGSAAAAETPPRLPLLLDGARAGDQIVVVGERGFIAQAASEAKTWREPPRVTRATLTAISFADPGSTGAAATGWAVGHDALILATHDGGQTWTKQFQGDNLQDSFLCVLALGPQHAIAAGAYGLYADTGDGGRTWSPRSIVEGDAHFYALARGSTGALYLAGERGTVLRSADEGRTWQPIGPKSTATLFGVLPLGDKSLLTHGLGGHVFRSGDDGGSWTEIPTPHRVMLATAVRLKSNAILLAGYAGTQLISDDDGRSFRPLPSPAKAVSKLLELPNGDVLSLGEMGAVVIPGATLKPR